MPRSELLDSISIAKRGSQRCTHTRGVVRTNVPRWQPSLCARRLAMTTTWFFRQISRQNYRNLPVYEPGGGGTFDLMNWCSKSPAFAIVVADQRCLNALWAAWSNWRAIFWTCSWALSSACLTFVSSASCRHDYLSFSTASFREAFSSIALT